MNSSSSPGSLSANAEYLQQAYKAWKENPAGPPADLASFFEGFEFAQAGCDLAPGLGGDCNKQSAVDSLIYHYRTVGHRIAQINPLGDNPVAHPELEPAAYGLTEEDLDRTVDANHSPLYKQATLRQILADLRETYCGFIGIEYMHIQETAERRWLQERMEGTKNRPNYSHEQHLRILWKLKQAERFENFLHTTYRGQKRFSLEGAETLIPALDHMVEQSPAHGIVEIVFGMAHRGRLNVLANIIGKSYDEIFSEFESNFLPDTAWGDGDVKYHKGYSQDVQTSTGQPVHLSLTANPSHLEMVSPVTQGKVRAKQALRGDKERKKVLPFIIHGDAAFAGQGVVAETFNLSQLKGYRTGGTIHFVINNQVGFTTTAQDYLSGLYCTDVAKMVAAPIFHVNGDHPEQVLHALDLALEYRQKFQKDVVIDMWCYRRHGHNESDEPSFTQPILYDRINKHPTVDDLYAEELAARNEPAQEETASFMARFEARLEQAKKAAAEGPKRREEDFRPDGTVPAQEAEGFGTSSAPADAGKTPVHENGNGHRRPLFPAKLGGYWTRLKREYSHEPVDTGVPMDTLKHIAKTIADIPEGFDVHRKVRKLMEDFNAQVQSGAQGKLWWANAEALAFGSLLMEGNGVRLSGEDSRRGTFSQRHAVMYDQHTGDKFIPLTCLKEGQPEFCVYDSALAELAVLAFDYGYAVADPMKLIMWEAQFGDFANGAQPIIDQFIAAGESKWGRMAGLVMLLPHGYEGQGPEHSNAWIRRYLSLCAEDNMQVVYPTTPAQYFHVLRRQLRRDFRRPLVVFTPKSLLRGPRAVSTVEELTTGHFQEVIHDPRDIKSPRRVLFCSGKVYYDLKERAEAEGIDDVAIVRVEQFYPISPEVWDEIETRYANVPEWAWVSEEPSNYGAWGFMHALLAMVYDGPIWYVGRARSASPAVGSTKMHEHQQKLLVDFSMKQGPLEAELVDGVGVFRRGVELWHMKSRSPRLASR